MNNIKFRAWFKEEPRMIKWNELHFEIEQQEMFLWIGEEGNFGTVGGYPLENFELMQSIGVKDKNGKEIYEGDIVKFKLIDPTSIDAIIGKIEWLETNFYVTHSKEHIYLLNECQDLEVIGNIYDNPNLLNGYV